jgi:hypothetical protein
MGKTAILRSLFIPKLFVRSISKKPLNLSNLIHLMLSKSLTLFSDHFTCLFYFLHILNSVVPRKITPSPKRIIKINLNGSNTLIGLIIMAVNLLSWNSIQERENYYRWLAALSAKTFATIFIFSYDLSLHMIFPSFSCQISSISLKFRINIIFEIINCF